MSKEEFNKLFDTLEANDPLMVRIKDLEKRLSDLRALASYAFIEGQSVSLWDDSASKKALERI